MANQNTKILVWIQVARKFHVIFSVKPLPPLPPAFSHANSKLEITRLLLQYCQDKNPERKDGTIPLHNAAKYGHLEITRLLLQHCQDKNPESKDGTTPLHYVTSNGHLEISQLLLQHSQDIDKNPADKNDRTLLHLAAGNVKIVKLIKGKFAVVCAWFASRIR
jgi:ankyrin repeat protein